MRPLLATLPLVAAVVPEAPPARPPPPPASEISDCGLEPLPVPGFFLEDVNPTSPTSGTNWTLTELLGTVSVVYFAGAT